MDLSELLSMVVIVTASGALAPGPLFFANVTHGTKSGARSGLAFSIGHFIVEFSLVMLLAVGVLTAVKDPSNEASIRFAVGVVGGAALVLFGAVQVRAFLTSKSKTYNRKRTRLDNPLLLGAVLSGLNPYFIVWWLTAGAKLILESLAFGALFGIIIMYAAHVWMDYVWLIGTAYLAQKGTNLIDRRGYKMLMAAFGIVLIIFGLYFIASSL